MTTMADPCPNPEALAGWLEQTLPAADRARVGSHLAGCDGCRRAVSIAVSVEAPPEGKVDEALLVEVVQASRFRPRNIWWAAAAAALVVTGLVFWATRPAAEEPDLAGVFEPPPAPEPVRHAPAAKVAERTTDEAPLPVKPDPAPVVPAPKPDPVATETPIPEPRKPAPEPEAVKPAPPVEPKKEPAPPTPRNPGTTEADLSRIFASLFVLDPSGDLWIHREGAEPARVGRQEQVGHRDTVSAQDSAGAFALDGKATLALEKGATVSVAWKKLDQAYSLSLSQGCVMVDTEGAAQKWQLSRGAIEVTFNSLNGRIVVEPRGDQLAAVMLAGRGELRVGSAARKLEAGRELLLSADQKVAEKAAEVKKFVRLGELRPTYLTVFAATFEERDEARPFSYSVPSGRLTTEGSRSFLHADVASTVSPRPGEKVLAFCSVKPDRPVIASDRILLSFWYRTNQPTFTVKLGKYSAVYTSRLKPMEWGEGRMQLAAFESEGVTILPTDELPDVQFQVAVDGKKVATLDVDGVQFLRRAK